MRTQTVKYVIWGMCMRKGLWFVASDTKITRVLVQGSHKTYYK